MLAARTARTARTTICEKFLYDRQGRAERAGAPTRRIACWPPGEKGAAAPVGYCPRLAGRLRLRLSGHGARPPVRSPVSARPRLAAATPAGRQPGQQTCQLPGARPNVARTVTLAPDCPARSHRVNGGPASRRSRSATPTIDPSTAPMGLGACEDDGQEQSARRTTPDSRVPEAVADRTEATSRGRAASCVSETKFRLLNDTPKLTKKPVYLV